MCKITNEEDKGQTPPPPPVARQSSEDTDTIIIRHYQDADKTQVHVIFRRGMLSLVPTLTKRIVTDPFFFLPLGSLACMIQLGVKLLSASSSSRRSSSLSHNAATTIVLPWLASTSFVAASVFLVYGIGRQALGRYIQSSIATDLSDIAGTYLSHGGTFLVAEQNGGNIVGCIAGQYHQDDDTNKLFELRRLSVDAKMQRRGLGRRLVQGLEEELQKSGCRHLYLATSSLQVSIMKKGVSVLPF